MRGADALRVRPMTADDIDAVRAIEATWRLASDADTWRGELAKPYARCAVAVLPSSGGPEVVGYFAAWIVDDEADLHDIAVAPGHRGLGIGAALMASLQATAQAAGATQIFLEVRRSNVAAQALYRRRGFARAGARRRYYADGEDAVIYTLSLAGPSGP